jgi:chromatin remodeling complex protein RSC6
MATKTPAKAKPAAKPAAKKEPAKKPAVAAKPKAAAGAKTNALQKPLTPSPELAAVVGAAALPRTEVVKKVWDYIKANNLQDPQNKREIVADDKLRGIFGKPKVTMFEMNKHLAAHLS